MIVDVHGNALGGGRKLRVLNGPLAGTVLTERDPEVRHAKIPVRNPRNQVCYLMLEKDASGYRFRGWSMDGQMVDYDAGTPECRGVTNQMTNRARELGMTFLEYCLRRPNKVKPYTPNDFGPHSADDLWGEDVIKDWEPPEVPEPDETETP